nr:hypothetical protein [Tanacetum cinerariifolium]
MTFVSSSSNNNTNSSNEAVNTTFGVTTAATQVNVANSTNINNLSDAIICAFLTSQSNSSQFVNEDLEQIHPDDLEEMDLKWQIAVKCYNYHTSGHFARECRAPKARDNWNRESTIRNVPVKTTNSLAFVSCDGLGGYDWSDQAKEGPNYALMAYSTSCYDFEWSSIFADRSDKGFLVRVDQERLVKRVPTSSHRVLLMQSRAIGNVLPPKPDLFGLKEFVNEPIVGETIVKRPVVENSEVKATKDKPQANPQQDLQEKGVTNSGCSMYMTGNMSYLTDYGEIDGGCVDFRDNPKGGKITGK